MWYVVIPFTTEQSAKLAAEQILADRGYGSSVRATIEDDPPECDPDDAEAQRIAEQFDEARAEQDRGL